MRYMMKEMKTMMCEFMERQLQSQELARVEQRTILERKIRSLGTRSRRLKALETSVSEEVNYSVKSDAVFTKNPDCDRVTVDDRVTVASTAAATETTLIEEATFRHL